MKHKINSGSDRRKKKEESDILTERLAVRLSKAEKHAIEEKALKRGLSVSDFCRRVLNRYQLPDRSEETREALRALIGMKNNLNQLAKYANAIKGLDQTTLEEIHGMCVAVDAAKKTIITK